MYTCVCLCYVGACVYECVHVAMVCAPVCMCGSVCVGWVGLCMCVRLSVCYVCGSTFSMSFKTFAALVIAARNVTSAPASNSTNSCSVQPRTTPSHPKCLNRLLCGIKIFVPCVFFSHHCYILSEATRNSLLHY